jgi:membrane associated rhomboid family serine protease
LIPLSDPSEPNRIFPYVNIAIIIINFLVFFYELALGSQGLATQNKFFLDYSLVPCEYTNHCAAYAGTPHPFWLTLFSSMFMHAGWLHILGNMLYLWVFGDNVENSMGHVRYLFFYLLCGLGASALEIATAVDSHTPGLGASGAIAGILGAYLVLYPRSPVLTLIPVTFILIPIRLPAFLLIGFWFALQFFNGIITLTNRVASQGGVAYWAHVGGFATGIILIWLFRKPERVSNMREQHARLVRQF